MTPAPQNKAARPPRNKDARQSARQRGYDATWEKAAAAFLAEPGNQRCDCGAAATVVRHVISIRQRPDLRMVRSNWKPGCKRCNSADWKRERCGYSDEIGNDGLPLDPKHPFNR